MVQHLPQQDLTIFNEMMIHPALFTHPHPRKIAIIAPDENLLSEALKHQQVTEAWQFSKSITKTTDPRAHYSPNDLNSWAKDHTNAHFDVIFIATPYIEDQLPQISHLLHHDGIMVQVGTSPFEVKHIKDIYDGLIDAKFSDIQLIQFPQPNFASGWRTAFLAKKHGVFKHAREKDIFNKSFSTVYYNFDIHKASHALPEFMRKELISA